MDCILSLSKPLNTIKVKNYFKKDLVNVRLEDTKAKFPPKL